MIEPTGIYISDKHTYEDYLKLNFEQDSSEDIWKEVIDIFISRINSRYFFAIDKLMKDSNIYDMLKYGFAIVTLQCSLIDTLAKFRYGVDKQRSKKRFTDFFVEYFLDGPNAENLADKVYEDIRCGLVHSGSTDNMSGISCDLPGLITVLKNGAISLNIFILDEKLREYFNQYIKKLENKSECELRKNFVYTMNSVCKAQ